MKPSPSPQSSALSAVSDPSDVAAAIDAGERLGELRTRATVARVHDGTVPFVVLNDGQQILKLEDHLERPLAARSTVTLNEAASFASYVRRFATPQTLVFGDLIGRKFEAIIDYHQPRGDAAWGQHRALYGCKTTPVWDEWTSKAWDGQAHTQVEFARFIEEHIPHIAEPAGAQLLSMCLTLEAKKDVQFRSSTRLDNGEHQFRFEESIQGQAGSQNGNLKIPAGFKVAIEPFQGIGLRGMDARFRYRINNGQLSMWYELVRPADVLDAAFTEVITQLRVSLGEIPLLVGAAPQIR